MRINIANPILGDDEIEQVTRVIQSGMIACGPETTKFELEFPDGRVSHFMTKQLEILQRNKKSWLLKNQKDT